MRGRRALTALLVFGTALLLSLFTIFLHAKALGLAYVQDYQVPRHVAMLAGTAGNPWQYRMLSAWIVEGAHRICAALAIPQPLIAAFLAVRVLEQTLLFTLAWGYWRALGLSSAAAFFGLALLGWSVSYANYGSDLQFNTYFDVLFYVLAATAVVRNRLGWLLLITLLAAFNRETSGFIPLLPLAALPDSAPEARARLVRTAVAGVVIYLVVFSMLRWAYGPQALIVPYGHRPGLDLMAYNFGRVRTWVQLVGTFSIVPFVALAGWREWPRLLRAFFWLLVPAWFVVHAVGAVMSETRLLLVPFALVLVPGALFLLQRESDPARRPRAA